MQQPAIDPATMNESKQSIESTINESIKQLLTADRRHFDTVMIFNRPMRNL